MDSSAFRISQGTTGGVQRIGVWRKQALSSVALFQIKGKVNETQTEEVYSKSITEEISNVNQAVNHQRFEKTNKQINCRT